MRPVSPLLNLDARVGVRVRVLRVGRGVSGELGGRQTVIADKAGEELAEHRGRVGRVKTQIFQVHQRALAAPAPERIN